MKNVKGVLLLTALVIVGLLLNACSPPVEKLKPQTSASPANNASPYSGAVDRRDCETVAGWVMDKTNPDAELKVDLYVDNNLTETMSAKEPRPDLAKVGTGRYGFSFKMPAAFKDDKPHFVNVKVAGSNYSVPVFQGVFAGFQCKPS
jgi:hypothetical protein